MSTSQHAETRVDEAHLPASDTPRTRVRRHPERSLREGAREVLAAGTVANVGVSIDSTPYVIPMTYLYDPASPDRLYLHSAKAGRLVKHLAGGAPVCVSVTITDGLVYSRSAKYHSMNYRSAMCLGHGHEVTDLAEKGRIFEDLVSRYFPDRLAGEDYQHATDEDFRSTRVIAVDIEEWSGKQRQGGPLGPMDGDEAAPGTAGQIDWSD